MDSPRFRFAPSRIIDSANRFVSEAADAGVIMNRAGRYEGSSVEVDGRSQPGRAIELLDDGGTHHVTVRVEHLASVPAH